MNFWKIWDALKSLVWINANDNRTNSNKETEIDSEEVKELIDWVFSAIDWLIYKHADPRLFLEKDICTGTIEQFEKLKEELEKCWLSMLDSAGNYTISKNIRDSKKSVTRVFNTFKFVEEKKEEENNEK